MHIRLAREVPRTATEADAPVLVGPEAGHDFSRSAVHPTAEASRRGRSGATGIGCRVDEGAVLALYHRIGNGGDFALYFKVFTEGGLGRQTEAQHVILDLVGNALQATGKGLAPHVWTVVPVLVADKAACAQRLVAERAP